uniref:Uncharacterized protein n=1 Tax=Psilocybe cubensis TaxID=181762 RepID=A0A8H7XN94_PSICU
MSLTFVAQPENEVSSPSFPWPEHRHLFETICVAGNNALEIHLRLFLLRSLLEFRDTGILPGVRILYVQAQVGTVYTLTLAMKIQILQNLNIVLDMLCHPSSQVETLYLSGPLFYSDWFMHQRITRSFGNLLKSNQLVSLKLNNVENLPRNILDGTSIVDLTLIACEVSNTMTYSNTNALRLPSLETIETDKLSVVRTIYPVGLHSTDGEEPSLKILCLRIDQTDTAGPQVLKEEFDILEEHFSSSIERLCVMFDPCGAFHIITSTVSFFT